MVHRPHEAPDDVITSGRDPRGRRPRLGGLIRLLIVVETAALAATIVIALHYRSEVGAHHPGGGPFPTSLTPASVPEVTSVALPLPAAGGATGTVIITAAVLPGADRAQFTVSAVITGALPDTYYNLIGNDCSATDHLPDDVWAAGLTTADGRADLVGYAWTGALGDEYWLVLDPSPVGRPPGLDGEFAEGQAAPFAPGAPPCGT